MMDLRVEKVTFKSQGKQKVKEIYTSSFLKEDRMPFWLMLIMAMLPNTDFLSFHDEDTLCGFVYMAATKRLIFVMFFAVDQSKRSQGYGGAILETIQAMHPDKKIILSIERCDEPANDIEERLRRKKFYLKNGYVETGYFVELANKKQELLIKNGKFDKREFILFFLRYSNGTMMPKVWKANS